MEADLLSCPAGGKEKCRVPDPQAPEPQEQPQTRLAPPQSGEPTFAPPGSPMFPDGATTVEYDPGPENHFRNQLIHTGEYLVYPSQKGFFARTFETAQQWRIILAIWLAALFSLTVVGSYLLSVQSDVSEVAADDTSESALKSMTEFTTKEASEDPRELGPSESEQATVWAEKSTTSQTDELNAIQSADTTPTSVTTTEPEQSTTSVETTETVPETTTTTVATPGEGTIVIDERTRIEAEHGGTLGSAQIEDTHKGYSATGYISGLDSPGCGIVVYGWRSEAGTVPISIRYSAGQPQPEEEWRSVTISVNGQPSGQAVMSITNNWNTWNRVTGEVTLQEGSNEIIVYVSDNDTGYVNIDYIEIG